MITSSKNLKTIFYIYLSTYMESYEILKYDISKFTPKMINRLIETKNRLVFSNENDCNDFCNNYLNDLINKKTKFEKEHKKQYNIWFNNYFKKNIGSNNDQPKYPEEYNKLYQEEIVPIIKSKLLRNPDNGLMFDMGFYLECVNINQKKISYIV